MPRQKVGYILLTIVMAVCITGCDELFSMVKTIKEDDVPPVVTITSHADGDTYYAVPTDLGLTPDATILSSINIDASISDVANDDLVGAISDIRIEVIGIPELSDSFFYMPQNNIHVDFEGYDFNTYSVTDEGDIQIRLDSTLVSGSITIKLSAEDWNGNIGTAEITLLPLDDSVAPVVVITSHADGDTYFPEASQDLLSELESVIVVEATISDEIAGGEPGMIISYSVAVTGYPELTDSTANAEDANPNVYFSFVDLSSEDEATAHIELDSTLLTGEITVKVSAEDWNGNIGYAEISLEPPPIVRVNEYLEGELILCVDTNSAGDLFVGTDNGLRVHGATDWTTYTTSDGLANDYITSLYIDDSNVLYVGTLGGLSVYDGTTWTSYTIDDGLSSNSVNSIFVDINGDIYVGTSGAGFCMYDGTSWTIYAQADGLAGSVINDIYVDDTGTIYTGGDGGVSINDGASWSIYEPTAVPADNYISDFFVDSAGVLYAAGGGSGLSIYDGTNWTNYTESDGLANNNVNSVYVDADGAIYLGTGDGMSIYDGSSWTSLLDGNMALYGDGAGSIYTWSADGLWRGLSVYEENE